MIERTDFPDPPSMTSAGELRPEPDPGEIEQFYLGKFLSAEAEHIGVVVLTGVAG